MTEKNHTDPGILRILAACLCLDDLYESLCSVCSKVKTRILTIIR